MGTGAAFDYKTAVKTNQVFNPFLCKEIIAYSHVRTDKIAAAQQEREPRGIEDDVSVVGDEECAMLDVAFYLFAVA